MFIRNFIAALCAATAVAACGGSGDGGTMVPTVASVTLSAPSATLTVGQTISVSAVVRDGSGNVLSGRALQWASGDVTLATVSATGLVSAIKAGRVEISATSSAVVGRTELQITEAVPADGPVASVEIEPVSTRIDEGSVQPFSAIVRDAAGLPLQGRAVAWSVLDPDIAYVTPGGELTALRSGATRLDATVEGKSASAGITVESAHGHGLLYSQAVAVGASELYLLDINDPAGSEVHIVLPGMAKTDPSAAPDGTRVAFTMLFQNETAIYVANVDGSAGAKLTTATGIWDQPAWSPDGTLIAFRGRLPGDGSDIWIMAADGTGAVSLSADHGATSESSPAWSAQPIDGAYRIVYSRSVNGQGHIWSMRADGTDKRQHTASTTDYDDMPAYSPDGATIVFVRSGSGIFGDLYLVDTANSAVRALTPLSGPIAGPQLEPTWSPDGKLIAFASQHVGQHYQIYTVWANGMHVVRRTSDPFDHSSPSWIAIQ